MLSDKAQRSWVQVAKDFSLHWYKEHELNE